jgi:hypothetical protein
MRKDLEFGEGLGEVFDARLGWGGGDGVALGTEAFGLGGGSAGEFFVQLAIRFDGPPIRSDTLFAVAEVLLGGFGSDFYKYAGGHGTGAVGLTIFGQPITYLSCDSQFPFEDFSYQGINI